MTALIAERAGTSAAHRQWKAQLNLGFEYRRERTTLVRRSHKGPLFVQKPFYPEGDEVCHTYVLHPPAGIAGGDELSISLGVASSAHALLTTPAATKFYRANPQSGCLTQEMHVETGAILEWLPQENIIFDAADALITTRVHVQEGSRFIAWDSLGLARPACDELFQQGRCRQRFEVWKDDRPLFIDAMDVVAGDTLQKAPWGLAGLPANGLMLAYPASTEILSGINAAIAKHTEGLCSASLVDEVLVIRSLNDDMETLQQELRLFWQLLRPQLLNIEACPPRVWNT